MAKYGRLLWRPDHRNMFVYLQQYKIGKTWEMYKHKVDWKLLHKLYWCAYQTELFIACLTQKQNKFLNILIIITANKIIVTNIQMVSIYLVVFAQKLLCSAESYLKKMSCSWTGKKSYMNYDIILNPEYVCKANHVIIAHIILKIIQGL